MNYTDTVNNLELVHLITTNDGRFSYFLLAEPLDENKINRLNKTTIEVTDVKIIVPNKVVEVTFTDGSKEKSVCREPDVFSLESAISICVSKKIMGGSGAYNNLVKRGLKVYEDNIKMDAAVKAEQERINKKRAKRKAYMERRAAKREETARERQIEIQKEAYIRAMEYTKDCACKR